MKLGQILNKMILFIFLNLIIDIYFTLLFLCYFYSIIRISLFCRIFVSWIELVGSLVLGSLLRFSRRLIGSRRFCVVV